MADVYQITAPVIGAEGVNATQITTQAAINTLAASVGVAVNQIAGGAVPGGGPYVKKAGDTMTGPLGVTDINASGNVSLDNGSNLLLRSGVALTLYQFSNSINATLSNDQSTSKVRLNYNFGVGGFLNIGDTATSPVLVQDAAGLLAQRNGTNAQSYRMYNTYTDASNYEALSINWNASQMIFQNIAAGTGALRTFKLGSSGAGNVAQIYVDYTNTGTVGAVTINKAAGRVNLAAAGTSLVVTNSLVTAASKVFAQVSQADATAYIKNVVPAAGSFTITLGAAATAQTSIDFFVVNAD